MGASDGAPFTKSRIAGRMLMKMVGGSFFTAATGGVLSFFTLAARRSSEMVMVAAGLRKRPHQLVHLRRSCGIERGESDARDLRIAEKDGVRVHVDGGLQLTVTTPTWLLPPVGVMVNAMRASTC